MKAYHNKGFGVAYMWILILVLIFPIFLLFVTLDTWVCKQTADCKIGRNFCND